MAPRKICKDGLNKMHRIIGHASLDIRDRLWTQYWLVRMTVRCKIVVELGTRLGDSTRAILAACEDTGSKLYSFDIENVEATVSSISTEITDWPALQRNWIFETKDSVEAANTALSNSPDLIFIDTDHSFERTSAEIAAWSNRLRGGG